MRTPVTVDELARLAQIEAADITAYREAGLLDPDGDGVFDDLDLLRLRLILHHRDLGRSIDEIVDAVHGRDIDTLYADLLYASAEERFTAEDASERVGMPVSDIVALRRAVGLPSTLLEERDLEMLRVIKGILDIGIPWDAILEAARVYGDTLKRLAETEIRIFQDYIVGDRGRGDRERAERFQMLAGTFERILDSFVEHIHRQHLLRAAAEDALSILEATEPAGARGERDATIVFADLASFTPLAQVHGDEEAARVLERFDALVRDVLGDGRGSIVKQIGDAFMLTFPDAADAVRFAIALDEAATGEPRFPAIRAGVHAGKVLYRVGDYVGHTVNVTARIAAIATAGEILVTEPVAAAAEATGIVVEPVGEHDFHGIEEPVSLWRVVRTGARASRRERDPVCGMTIKGEAAARLVHGGFDFAFCSEECLKRFLEHPSRYMERDREEKPTL